MCGITGYIHFDGGRSESASTLLAMLCTLRHRGPDDEGVAFIDTATGWHIDLATDATATSVDNLRPASAHARLSHDIGLGHTRFSIVDLSAAGHQPFWSNDQSVCVIFNGEIYNHVELRRELSQLGHSFRSESDTEVLVEAYREWGTGCFQRFAGFWAIALYDAQRRQVLLARDRIGKAPLYIARLGRTLFFASEIPAILEATGRNAFPIREQAVADFAAHSFRDVDHQTFYEGIVTFPNASFGWVQADGSCPVQSYWRLPERRLSEREFPVEEAAAEFRDRLGIAVEQRMRADVPIGFELSGGLDSSCLVAAAALRGRRIHAFTVSFPGTDSDEEPYARLVAERYRDVVHYSVLKPPADEFWGEADEYVGRLAEPFHAPNTLTNRGVWRAMAREGIRVSINGAAGDESWCGYFNDYYEPFLRHLVARGNVRQLVSNCRLFGESPHSIVSPTFLRRLRTALSGRPKDRPGYMTSSPGSRPYLLPDELNPLCLSCRPGRGPAVDLEPMLADHMGPWRMNYWLRVANASYMSVPTELRCPFLDHRLIELAFSVPVTYLIRDGWLKWLPRTAMAKLLPDDVVWRKRKMGFPFPYVQWAVESRTRFFSAIGKLDCPYVDMAKLAVAYDGLARTNPLFLWRVMSLCLWWKRCILGETLAEQSKRIAA